MSSALSRLVEDIVDDAAPGPPGACLTVAAGDSLTSYLAGFRQVFDDGGALTEPLPMSERTAHDMGSVTKVIGTTAAIMNLVETGDLRLDAPVGRFVRSWPGAGHGPDVTVADLLLHRAGLWEWWPTYLTARDGAAALRVVTELPLRYRPHSGRHYSDLGFMMLGQIVETVADMPLRAVIEATVFMPLGMGGSRCTAPEPGAEVAAGARGDVIERRMIATAEPYPVTGSTSAFAGWRDRVRVGEVDDGNAYHAFGGLAGHAGVFSSAADLMTFGHALLSGLSDGGRWRRDTVRRFLTEGPDPGQALGFRRWTSTVDGHRTTAYGHTGFPGVAFAVLPEYGTTVALLTNRLHVIGPPTPFEPLWLRTLDTVHGALRHSR